MARGFKTGGRQSGTPNADKKELSEMIAARFPDYHPVMAMVEMANDMKNEVTLRFQANKEVAKYVCPQLKSIDVSSHESVKIKVRIKESERQIFKINDQAIPFD